MRSLQARENVQVPIPFTFSHRPWDADILSCACSFMFTADSMRGPSLDDTRISPPSTAPHGDVKFFYKQWTLIAYRWHWIVSLSHAKDAKDAEIYSLSYFTLALEWSQTSLRQECAERLSTPSPLRGTTPVSGVESGWWPTTLSLK